MKPLIHAQNSVKKWGGVVEDYLPIHDFFDSSKAFLADVRHRAIFHSAFGIFIVEKVFGTYITNQDNKRISVRDIGEQHVMEDLGFIPTAEQWLRNIPIAEWMNGGRTKSEPRHIPIDGIRSAEFRHGEDDEEEVLNLRTAAEIEQERLQKKGYRYDPID